MRPRWATGLPTDKEAHTGGPEPRGRPICAVHRTCPERRHRGISRLQQPVMMVLKDEKTVNVFALPGGIGLERAWTPRPRAFLGKKRHNLRKGPRGEGGPSP